MAKKIEAYIKLQVAAGQANPSPPVGPALGQRGVNIMEFCKAFNAKTQGMEPGLPIPTVITVYSDRSFTFITKTPPAPVLLKKAAGILHLLGMFVNSLTVPKRLIVTPKIGFTMRVVSFIKDERIFRGRGWEDH